MSELRIASIRPICRDDLPRLAKPRDRAVSTPQRMRDSHHNVARLLALGHSHKQVAAITGYSPNRIGQLAAAPAMQDLIARYRGRIDQAFDEAIDAYADLAVRNMLAAERQLSDRLDEADAEGETLPVRELVAITSDRADRFGYPKRAVNTNVNVDFAQRLDAAIARSKAAPRSSSPLPALAQPPFRRIA